MCDPDDAVRSDRAACLGTGLVAYQGEDQRIRATDNLPFMLIFYFSVHLEDGASHGAACAMLAWIEGSRARACLVVRTGLYCITLRVASLVHFY